MKRPKINEKEAGVGPLKISIKILCTTPVSYFRICIEIAYTLVYQSEFELK